MRLADFVLFGAEPIIVVIRFQILRRGSGVCERLRGNSPSCICTIRIPPTVGGGKGDTRQRGAIRERMIANARDAIADGDTPQ